MHYRVYADINGWKEVDVAVEEIDVIDTIGFYIANNSKCNFIVILNDGTQDIPYKTIKNHIDYIKYLQEVTDREKMKNKEKIKELKK